MNRNTKNGQPGVSSNNSGQMRCASRAGNDDSQAAICSLSRDGRRVAWTFVDGILVRELDSGREIALPLDGVARYVRFSPGSDRLLIVTDQSSTLRESATGRTLWNHPGDAPAIIEARRGSAL